MGHAAEFISPGRTASTMAERVPLSREVTGVGPSSEGTSGAPGSTPPPSEHAAAPERGRRGPFWSDGQNVRDLLIL